MKRAPIIPKTPAAAVSKSPSSIPAAPMVDSLISRVGAMKGNAITLPVCGRSVKFVLETISAERVKESTCVWSGNERAQELLTEDALDDLIPSFLLNGQQIPAFGRRIDNLTEIADGSRRRMSAILTSSDYRVLIGDLDDEQMNALSKIGNDYRPTSAYERGRRYSHRLANEFDGNISALAEAENISRKVITRCLNTAKLPLDIIALFSHPGELSARAGEQLQKLASGQEERLTEKTLSLAEKRKSGILLESDEILEELTQALRQPGGSSAPAILKRQFAPGASVHYKGDKIIFNLDRTKIPEQLIRDFEKQLARLKA